jgi:hypothetical protein
MKLQNELHLGNKILRNEEYQSLHDWLSAGNSILKTILLRTNVILFFVHSFEVAIIPITLEVLFHF